MKINSRWQAMSTIEYKEANNGDDAKTMRGLCGIVLVAISIYDRVT